jgi:nickel-dependent lactate racemase
VKFPYGRGAIDVDVEGDLIQHGSVAVADDEQGAIEAALRNPIGTPPLAGIVRPGERVAILVNDITRLTRTDLFLPLVVAELNRAGVPDSDIFIVFALGIHRRQTEAERREIIGGELFRRIRNFDHDAMDQSSLVRVGVTSRGNTVEINREVWEADRIILTGEIIHHLIAGFSGGRKALVPGVAGARTTTFNHSMIFDPRCRSGALDGNPAHEDLLEACRMVDPDFLVNVVLSPDGRLIRVVAGHYDLAHREGCLTVDEAFCCEIDEPYDMVVASAGGYPLDVDLRQAHKPLENACRALREGGTMVFFAECPDGAGHPKVKQYLETYADDRAMEQALRARFEVGGHKAWWIARLGRMFDIRLVSGLDDGFVRRCGFEPVPAASLRRLNTDFKRVALIPHAGHTLPTVIAAQAQAL